MRYRILHFAAFLLLAVFAVQAEKLVILHTNDTHSQITPDEKDRGGAGRRMALFDSIRAVEQHVMCIDAGDAVQGTLYYNLYGGKVEQDVMNLLGYDLRIIGNHEFDNGVDSLASVLQNVDSELISTNYDLTNTPLDGMFGKYAIREFGGRRIGFMGINLNPKGIVAPFNYAGVHYIDSYEAADVTAMWLRVVEDCDLVVAITHIGHDSPGDVGLAAYSENIDIIIGGHSHTYVTPAESRQTNLAGSEILVTQVEKAGRHVGKITIDLETLDAEYEVLKVDSRYDDRIPAHFEEYLAPYRAGVDSLMLVPVGCSKTELEQESQKLLNWVSDMVLDCSRKLADNVDFALMNKGGIRRGLPKGTITEGEVICMLPFTNFIEIIDIKGENLMPAFEQMARVGGNGVSDGVEIVYKTDGNEVEIEKVKINGKVFDPEKTYRVATIDYLSNGGDYMPSLAKHSDVALSRNKLFEDALNYIREGKEINPSGKERMKRK